MKAWHKAPLQLPPHWRGLTLFKRALMLEYRRIAARDGADSIAVAGDPIRFLVRELDLADRKDRAPAVRSTSQLFEAGLLTLQEGVVHVHDTPEIRTGSVRDRDGIGTGPVQDTDRQGTKPPYFCPSPVRISEPKHSESLDTCFTDREREESRGEKIARARVQPLSELPPVTHFRRPLGDPPLEALAELKPLQATAPKHDPLLPDSQVALFAAKTWRAVTAKFWLAPSWEPPADFERLAEDIGVAAAEAGNTVESLIRCGLYRYAAANYARNKKRAPALGWIFKNSHLSNALHDGADLNPPDWQPVPELHLEVAQ